MRFLQDLLPTSLIVSSITTATLTLLCTLAVVLVLHKLWPMVRLIMMSRKLPGPNGWMFLFPRKRLRGSGQKAFNVLKNRIETYGKICRFWFFTKPWVMVVDPDDVQKILLHPKSVNRHSYVTKAIITLFDDGLLSLRDDKWKRHRKAMNPMFHHSILKSNHVVIEQKAQELCEQWSTIADGTTVDLFQFASLFSLDAIFTTVFGVNLDIKEDVLKDYAKATDRADELTLNWFSEPWLRLPWLQMFFAVGRETVRVKKGMDDFVEQIISKRLEEYRNSSRLLLTPGVSNEKDGVQLEHEDDFENPKDKRASSILDLMIIASERENTKFSPDEIKGELQNMIFAGYKTTAATLCHLFLLLGIHGDVQDEISRELDEVFGSDTRPATAEDVSRLTSLDRAIKETLRLFPAVPLLPREVWDDVTLPSGPTLPAGASVLIFTYKLHRDPRYFPDPERFNPDRWLPGNRPNGFHPYAYIPFGAGPRNCIGNKYATLQLKVAASCLLRRFKVSTHTTMEDLIKNINVASTLKCDVGYEVQLMKRV